MLDPSSFPSQVGNAACLFMRGVCSSSTSLSWQGLGPQGTAVKHSQPSHTLAMLLQDLKLDTAKSDWWLDGTGPGMQICT